MNESVRLGKIAGINVGINWSVLVIFFLITVSLAFGRFPFQFPDLTPPAHIAAGLGTAALFFFSLLAHEVAHAVVARRNGIAVDGITLWLFGGVARLRGEARDPGAELRISGVGPLVSVGLGAVFGALAWGLGVAGAAGIVVAALLWLAAINVVLAVFNLVPAAPLDGGRILRAILWRTRGDRTAAAATAARAGRAFGFVVIALGLVEFMLGAGLGGLWLVLIGWFLVNAANAEYQQAQVQDALIGTRVAEIMTRNPATVPATLSVQEFIDDYLFQHRFSAFPLVDDDGRAVGLLTLNRVKDVPRADRSATLVAQIACRPEDLALAAPDEPLSDLLGRMGQCADGRAIVVQDERVVGIVSPTDIARRLEAQELRGSRSVERV